MRRDPKDSTSVCYMQDPKIMPEKITALLEANGASDISVTEYENMTGGYSRIMARFEASFTIQGNHESGSYVLRGDPPEGQAIIDKFRSPHLWEFKNKSWSRLQELPDLQ